MAILSLALGFIGVLLAVLWYRKRQLWAKLPPFLPGLPIIGNLLQGFSMNHLTIEQWRQQCGPIFSLNMAGQAVVVVANVKAATEVLDKMSAVTAERPPFLVVNGIMTHGLLVSLAPYGETWKRHRRGAHEALNIRAAEAFYSVQEDEALLLAKGLLMGEERDNLALHTTRAAASTVWRALYGGSPIQLVADPKIEAVNGLIARVVDGLKPTGFGAVVDLIPALMYLPTAVAPFRREAEKYFSDADAFYKRIAKEACERRTTSVDLTSLNLCASLDEKKLKFALSDQDVAWLSGQLFLAGAETSATTLEYFILAMLLYPDVARKAQEELDSVITPGHPPSFADQSRLPYIMAVVKETMRWRPVVASGVPHVATADVFYEGYLIPRGTMIVCPLWSICHDPDVFPDPDEFKPERFLGKSDSVSSEEEGTSRFGDFQFGFGRRICVGRDVAMNAVFIDIAMLFWAFEFKLGLGEDGGEALPSRTEFNDTGIFLRPGHFRYRLVPRSEGVVDVLSKHVSAALA